jgi:hypothetical protein
MEREVSLFGEEALLPILAILLALLVFVPDVAVPGSWASPASTAHIHSVSDHAAVATAELAPPTSPSPPLVWKLVLVIVALGLAYQWLDPHRRASLLPPIQPPGLRGRALLHAYLN